MRRALFILLLLPWLSGCDYLPKKSEDTITGLWDFQGNGGDNNEVEEEAYLNLRTDKTYTFYQPYYFDYGHWTFDGKKIKMRSDRKKVLYLKEWEMEVVDKEKDVLKISFSPADQVNAMQDAGTSFGKERIIYKVHKNIFLNRSNVQFDPDKDPFSLQHSRWRLVPEHKETCAEIRQRVIGNLEHLCLLFEKYANSDAESVSWKHSPHPYFLASNGMSMDVNSKLPDGWINTFYDADDETDAYNMISKLFDEDIDVPLHYKKYSEMWYSILHQMYGIAVKKDLCTAISNNAPAKQK